MTDSSHAVFLSYASQDAEAAQRICEALRAAGIEVWFDQSELRGGDAWDRTIRRQIRDCALFVPIMSRNTQARTEGYFRLEWHLAEQRSQLMARNRVFILPIAIDDTSDSAADVPESFASVQWTRLLGGEPSRSFIERVSHLLLHDCADIPASSSVLTIRSEIPGKSIAVLPFVDLSANKDQEYFSDGLAEELINLLTQVLDLRVPARTSSFYFKGKPETIARIAETLRVAHVLEGSVRKAGNKVRVTVHLIRAENGYHIWSKTFDRDIENIFTVQDEIAAAVVQALKAQLLPNQRVTSHHRTESKEAYDQYLRAMQLYNLRTVESTSGAVAALQQAIVLDPTYAPAYAMLAMSKFGLVELGVTSTFADAEAAFTAADQSVTLAPELAEAYSARGYVRLRVRWDWSGARADLDKAMQLDPRNGATQCRYAFMMGVLGGFSEAIAAAERAIEINPLEAVNWVVLGVCLEGAGENAAATRAFRHALEISPAGATALANLVIVELAQGNLDEAFKANGQQQHEAWRWMGDAMVHHALGRAEQSERALDELIKKYGRVTPYIVAGVYAYRGEFDEAFQWLDRAFAQRDASLCMIKIHGRGINISSDPRYQSLVRKMNLPEG